jgi:uncharacterized protein (TIGR02246 family)
MNTLRATLVSAATLIAIGLSLPASAQTSQSRAMGSNCLATSNQQIAALFDRWNNSLRTLDPNQVVANYAVDAVLLPTVSDKPRLNPTEIREYFVKFLKNAPQGSIDSRTIKIGCNVAQDVGTYTFRFKDGTTVQARYTYVYEWQNGRWLIAHHHSSAMPEGGAGK